MEIISTAFIINFIDKHSIEYRSSQKKLCLPIISRLYKKMKNGIQFTEIKIDDGLICDGHHRYIASLLANVNIATTHSFRTSTSQEIFWHSVTFDENDWDSTAKIDLLNQQDATYNDISLETLMEMLK
jgi:hypothetical protein